MRAKVGRGRVYLLLPAAFLAPGSGAPLPGAVAGKPRIFALPNGDGFPPQTAGAFPRLS